MLFALYLSQSRSFETFPLIIGTQSIHDCFHLTCFPYINKNICGTCVLLTTLPNLFWCHVICITVQVHACMHTCTQTHTHTQTHTDIQFNDIKKSIISNKMHFQSHFRVHSWITKSYHLQLHISLHVVLHKGSKWKEFTSLDARLLTCYVGMECPN